MYYFVFVYACVICQIIEQLQQTVEKDCAQRRSRGVAELDVPRA